MTLSTRAVRILLPAAILVASWRPVAAADTPPPETVAIPGTLQSELGCSGDWQPECEKTFLVYDAEDDVWQGAFLVAPGDDQDQRGPRYKAALNGSWDENYGLKAQRGGPDIPLVVPEPTAVKFYYDHKTHWVTDDFNSIIAVAIGTFQDELGCAADNDPACLRSWLQDPDGDGIYAFATAALPPGDYEVFVALGEGQAETYAADGTPGGAPTAFTVTEGAVVYFGFDSEKKTLLISTEGAPLGNLGKAQAHWVARDTILWNVVGSPRYAYALHYDPQGALKLEVGAIAGGQSLPLSFTNAGPGEAVSRRYPHLAGYSTFKLRPEDAGRVPDILKGQIAVTARDDQGKLIGATSLQIPGVLDDLYPYDGPLGVTWDAGVPTVRVWAPTARSVRLYLFDDSATETSASTPMVLDAASGVWSAVGQPGWNGKFFLYEVDVFVRASGRFERNLVTDPYSLSLSTNSRRSQIVDLDDPALMPEGWAAVVKPPLAAPEDSVIYELHIRDFSVGDQSVRPDYRGTFLAFTEAESNGMRHLRGLAEAGLTHIHLLPAFDIASVNEDRSTWLAVDAARLAGLPPESEEQALAVSAIAGQDGFNWGYDPLHYSVPEGSYATDPDGAARIREFRAMVAALNRAGLRVVMDVVYNHTNASGQSVNSVLDRIVPGYYHRLNGDGDVEKSTCCENTASEHAQMRKLMVDSVLTWAAAYKVDGFRFDLMGHHMLADMQAVRAALDGLTPARDGVDGRAIYVYGEGWDFGEVADNARGRNASQLNIGGTGIGVFNDRLRDGARGGNPFGDPREQGFATGLLFEPNAAEARSADLQRLKLLDYLDWIRLGLAGNLRDYRLVNAVGLEVAGANVGYNGAPAGYTLDPQENVVYVSAHDNETLFDAIQLKAAASASLADRVRMNNLAVSLVMLSQGVPFFHAGDDLLRSKSLDRNSYNSGDWFNRLDFTYTASNFGVGLPIEGRDRWEIMRPLLADARLRPGPAEIQQAAAHFREMLAIRKSSPLFRLRAAEDVLARVSFLNTGPDQNPALIVMRLDDTAGANLDSRWQRIVVVFNAAPDAATFAHESLEGQALELHPLQAGGADPVVKQAGFDPAAGSLSVPGRTAAVFVLPQPIIPADAALGLAALGVTLAGAAGYWLWRRRRGAAPPT